MSDSPGEPGASATAADPIRTRRYRTRCLLKWVGLVASLLLAAACIFLGGGRGFGFTLAGRTAALEVSVYHGTVHLTIAHLSEAHTPLKVDTALYRVDSGVRDHQWSRIREYALHGVSCRPVRLPLYWVLLVVAGLTAILWYRDRGRPGCPVQKAPRADNAISRAPARDPGSSSCSARTIASATTRTG